MLDLFGGEEPAMVSLVQSFFAEAAECFRRGAYFINDKGILDVDTRLESRIRGQQ
jgi:hypothetical protein